MTKILYLVDGLPNGGLERQMSLLLKYLSPAWETHVVSLGDGPYHQVLLDQKTRVVVYNRRSRFDLIPVLQLYFEILRYKPDIIHTWGSLSSALVAPLCKVLHIFFIDGSIRYGSAPNRHFGRTKIALLLADHVVANSYAGLYAHQISLENASVIYNAIDPVRLELLKPRFNTQKDVMKVVMAGRIYDHKDFLTFFEAARRLNALEPGYWKFIAIGTGDEKDRESFLQLAEDLIAVGAIEFPQAGLEVLPYIKDANVGVLLNSIDPSNIKEGFSNSIMEYMACKLPVVCTDSGGNKELVLDGETGFVIPPEDLDFLIDKLLFLKEHPDISNRMGKMGCERVHSLCSIERMVSEYEAIYSQNLQSTKL